MFFYCSIPLDVGVLPSSRFRVLFFPRKVIIMLMLTRKRGQRIVIGGELIVRTTDIGCGWVRFAVDGPWPELHACRVRLPMYPDESPLFNALYARPVGVAVSVSDGPCFDLEEAETLYFSSNVFVHVVRIFSGGRVRLGVEAPPEVPVHRWETFLSIINEGRPLPVLG